MLIIIFNTINILYKFDTPKYILANILMETSPQFDLESFKSGDKACFEYLHSKYNKQIFHYVLRYIKNSALCYDIVQDSFLKLWENKSSMKNWDNIIGFLHLTSKNAALNLIRRAALDKSVREEILKDYEADETAYSEYLLIDKDYRAYIKDILLNLPEQTQLIFRKCKIEQLSYEEVALELGISKNTVKKHMVRALKLFREDPLLSKINKNTLIILFLLTF